MRKTNNCYLLSAKSVWELSSWILKAYACSEESVELSHTAIHVSDLSGKYFLNDDIRKNLRRIWQMAPCTWCSRKLWWHNKHFGWINSRWFKCSENCRSWKIRFVGVFFPAAVSPSFTVTLFLFLKACGDVVGLAARQVLTAILKL